MALDGGTQNLCVNLCGPNVLVSEHSGYIFDGDIMRQGECGKAVAGDMEGQILLDAKLCLYQVKVIICLLVGNFGQFEVIFLQYFHSWRKDWGEELCIGLDAVSINENQITLLHRHGLIVKVLHIAECKTCVSGEDEEVAHPFQLSIKGIVAHFLQFGFK